MVRWKVVNSAEHRERERENNTVREGEGSANVLAIAGPGCFRWRLAVVKVMQGLIRGLRTWR